MHDSMSNLFLLIILSFCLIRNLFTFIIFSFLINFLLKNKSRGKKTSYVLITSLLLKFFKKHFSFSKVSSVPCTNNTCSNGGTCFVNSLGLQFCLCSTGFTGALCQFASTCSGSPCQNGAVCSAYGGSYVCNCSANYYGPNCNYQITTQQCNAGDKNATNCALWSSNGLCNYSFSYNSVPVPVYCVSSCNVCNSNCVGKCISF